MARTLLAALLPAIAITATWLSLEVAALTAIFTTAIGTLAAYALSRHRLPGRSALLALLPLIDTLSERVREEIERIGGPITSISEAQEQAAMFEV